MLPYDSVFCTKPSHQRRKESIFNVKEEMKTNIIFYNYFVYSFNPYPANIESD